MVDSAVKEVESSNQTLVENMNQVYEVMEVMTSNINGADLISKEMLSKYEESAQSAISIETVVGHLMEELGVGGFMGVQDVKVGMKIAVGFRMSGDKKREYIGEVVDCVDTLVYVSVDDQNQDIIDRKEKDVRCQLRIVIDNVLYRWDDVPICFTKNNEMGKYRIKIETNPQVFNRRKYPRMPINNSCSIKVKETGSTYSGRMINISANGFAFVVKDAFFANAKSKNVVLEINSFDVLRGKAMEGCIIRSSDNEGEYTVGCRMPEDIEAIREYVSRNYCE